MTRLFTEIQLPYNKPYQNKFIFLILLPFIYSLVRANEPPTALQIDNSVFAENQPRGTLIGTLSAEDPDEADHHRFFVVGGTEEDLVYTKGDKLYARESIDYETQPYLDLVINVTDRGRASEEFPLSIKISDTNDAPTDLHFDGGLVSENLPVGTSVGSLTLEDVDPGAVSPEPDDSNFPVLKVNLESVKHNSLLNAESLPDMSPGRYVLRLAENPTFKAWSKWPADSPTNQGWSNEFHYSLNGRNSIGHQVNWYYDTEDEALANGIPLVVDVWEDEYLRLYLNDGFAASNRGGLSLDIFLSAHFSLVEGRGDTDNHYFTVEGTELKVLKPLNFEEQQTYSLRLKGMDPGGLTIEKNLEISARNEPDAPSRIYLTNDTIAEASGGDYPIGNFMAEDEDAREFHSFIMVEHPEDLETDNEYFTIKKQRTGTFLFSEKSASFDYETKTSYTVYIQATDKDGLTLVQPVEIHISNSNEPPVDLEISTIQIEENIPSGTEVATLTTVDPDLVQLQQLKLDDGAIEDSHTYFLVSGEGDTNNRNFRINRRTGVLQTRASFDFESSPNLSIRVRSSDEAKHEVEKVFLLEITNTNDPPSELLLSPTSISMVEEEPVGTIVGTLSVRDVDSDDPNFGESHTFELTEGNGDSENNHFEIEGNLVKIKEMLIHKDTPKASFHVTVTDNSGGMLSKTFDITVLDRNDPPTEIILDHLSVLENLPHGTLVGSLSALDPDERERHSFALIAGEGDTDNDKFFILEGNQLVTSATFDFEDQQTRQVRIEATDKDGATFAQAFEIQVSDEVVEVERIELAVSKLPADGGLTAGAGLHERGADVTLEAIASPGYSFAGWTGDLPDGVDPGDLRLQYKLEEARNVQAIFSRKFHKVDVTIFPERHGYAKGGGLVLYDTEITLMAEELSGEDNVPFSHWRINNVDHFEKSDPTLVMHVQEDLFAEAVFDIGLDKSFVLIPAGSYTREPGTKEEHVATVSAFYTNTHETTKEEWYEVFNWATKNGYSFDFDPTGPNGRNRAHNDRTYLDEFPITGVTWGDMVRWCNARSEREGWTHLYYMDDQHTTPIRVVEDLVHEEDLTPDRVAWRARGYRLPTELEWERAARGGLEGKLFPTGDTIDYTEAFFNNKTNTRALDSTVRNSRKPNGYGLYDIVGNAWEATWDLYSRTWYENPNSWVADNKGPGVLETALKRNIRTARGGSGNSAQKQLVIGNRTMLRTWNQYAITLRPVFAAPTEPDATLEASTEQAHLGSVTGGGVYKIGATASLQAFSKEGAEFVEWLDEEGNSIGVEPALEIELPADRTVQAVFQDISDAPELFTLLVSAEPEDKGSVTGTGAYLADSRVTVTATPIRGEGFAGWSGDAFSTNRVFRYKIQQHSQLSGIFGNTSRDNDRDGLSNLYESIIGSDPNNQDSDGDKLRDGQEINIFQSNPINEDTDGDGHDDRSEVFNKTSLTDAEELPFLPRDQLARYYYSYRSQPFDFSGNKGHATAFNLHSAPDRAQINNRAFSFDGFSSHIETTGYNGILGSAARTFACWIRVPVEGSGSIFSYGAPGANWEIRIGNGGVLEVEAENATLTTSDPLDDEKWHHILVTLPENGTPADIAVYIDSKPIQSIIVGEIDTPLTTASDSPIFIGKNSDEQHLRADLDELRIWERHLIAHEAHELYDLEVPKEPDVIPPTLEENLEDQIVTLGDTATFSVKVKAKPDPTYSWEKYVDDAWQLVRGPKSNTYTIESVEESDAVSYRVTISNSQGSLTTHPARILVKTKPTITKVPEDVSLLINKGGRIYAHVAGSSPLIFEWFKDGQSLGTGPNSYFIPGSAIQEEHGGNYFYRVSNEMGSVRSPNFRVSIVDRIVITKDPQTQGIVEGQPGFLSVEVEGTGDILYQWKKYDHRSRSFFDVEGAIEPTYSIPAMTKSDEGIYICEVTNGASADSSKRATLTMYITPVFEVQPTGRTVTELGRTKIITRATGDPAPSYQWQKYNSNTDVWEDLADFTRSYLYFSKTLNTHAGRYRLLANNLGGTTISDEIDINVYFRPSLSRAPRDLTVNEGEDVTLRVEATARDRRGTDIRYEWYHNKSPVSDGRNISGSKTATLELSGVAKEHNGSWYCVLSNEIGRTQTHPGKLNIIEKPYALNDLEDKNLTSGDYLTLAVSVRGNKPLTLQWYKNGLPIEGATVNKLHIRSMRPTDTGVYTFEAINPAGRLTLSSTVLVTSASTGSSDNTRPSHSTNEEGDDDNDGLSNFMEQVLGSDPLNHHSAYFPTVEIVENSNGESFLAYYYSESTALSGVTIILEQSTDLVNWEPVDLNEASIHQINRGGFVEKIVYLPTQYKNRFLRLRVEKE